MIDDRSVPIVVAIVALVIVLAIRPIARSRRVPIHRRPPPPGPDAIEQLAELLGVGIQIESVDAGPPARITAVAMLDGGRMPLEGHGAIEEDAWRDLARAAIVWKREEGRTVRFWWGA